MPIINDSNPKNILSEIRLDEQISRNIKPDDNSTSSFILFQSSDLQNKIKLGNFEHLHIHHEPM
jgi:hypothetical protein